MRFLKSKRSQRTGIGSLLGVREGLHARWKNLALPEPESGGCRGRGNGFVLEVVQEIELCGGPERRSCSWDSPAVKR
jgi:hypothetical protein